jgi:predicted PurR-regulated permease PerM
MAVATVMSSKWTPFYKFILPLLGGGGMCVAVWHVHEHPQEITIPPGFPPSLAWVFVLAAFVAVAAVLWIMLLPLKRVELDDGDLIISNYRTEIRVPLENVESIDDRSMSNPRRYTVTFREPTDFGRRIVFLEPVAWTLNPWHKSQEIAELRSAWAAVQAKRRD